MDIRDVVTPMCGLLALGEPTHWEPAFGHARNELFARLVDLGFRSIALETDQVAALAVDDYVRGGDGVLDDVLATGFSHGFGALPANRELITWMRDRNADLPAGRRLAFHGFDAPVEMSGAPGPRRYLEHVHAYLEPDRPDHRIADLAGDDDWRGPVGVAAVDGLRVVADELLIGLHARASELIAATSRAAWNGARAHLAAGLGLLRYHRQAATALDPAVRYARLAATRTALMALNLADVRDVEAGRGPTLAFTHNGHAPQLRAHVFIAGSLGRSAAFGLAEPAADTYEGVIGWRATACPLAVPGEGASGAPPLAGTVGGWGLATAVGVGGRPRTDTGVRPGYVPLDPPTVAAADAFLHVEG
ncbi:erythromycin esterase family protein [Saccharothrix obliqua]|uniref:erythromycin esterase family protein n=1 Tax=Saccharothrix obliqua TaxID=2861747 RepID=UPI001C6071E4|nr:erythromycin esterase family protein [Saccharothrix obliqua]MBW4715677.1 erythromycin esterase family protein [Saccharothrix obliqua]